MSKNEKLSKQQEVLDQNVETLEGKPASVKPGDDASTFREICLFVMSQQDPKAEAKELLEIYEVAKKIKGGREVLEAEDIVIIKNVLGKFIKSPILLGACTDKAGML